MKIGTSRVEAFSDGVIAIIITIMVLELKLPDISKDVTTNSIISHLHHLLPYFLAYVFSFCSASSLVRYFFCITGHCPEAGT